jgi:hypothetical protein
MITAWWVYGMELVEMLLVINVNSGIGIPVVLVVAVVPVAREHSPMGPPSPGAAGKRRTGGNPG